MKHIALTVVVLLCVKLPLFAQTLEQGLASEDPKALVSAIHGFGDAKRGAIVFHQVTSGCVKCHSVTSDEEMDALGPNLALLGSRSDANDIYVVESILKPSATIRKGFESITVSRTDGTVVTGLKVSEEGASITVRDTARQNVVIPKAEIEQMRLNSLSIMPAGVVNTLGSRQQFLDLAKYLFEIRDGGAVRAKELQPPQSLIAFHLPDYESNVDHQGLIRGLNEESFSKGQAIYERLCINCHGTLDHPGSLPTALRFGEGKFRNGSDPYAMYRTLTHGFGLMVPQTWMVPRQKYDVIHYIREAYVKPHNPSQFHNIEESYLTSLPAGNTDGPEPVASSPWSDMDYGPWMFNTVEVGRDGSNIAYKGLAVRLDPGPGGISRGNQWMIFDHDTMRVAAGWRHREGTTRFIDWQGIHFDGRHQAHPHAVGDVVFSNSNGPGWANPSTGSFDDDQRVLGRDGKRYGPLPKSWARYHGMSHTENGVMVNYSIGDMDVAEKLEAANPDDSVPVFLRTLTLQPTTKRQQLLVATDKTGELALRQVSEDVVRLETPTQAVNDRPAPEFTGHFDGSSWLEIADTSSLDMATDDFTIKAKIKTSANGVIFAQTVPGPKWVQNGTVLFIRGGKLCYDIGWVGVIQSNKRIADDQWHDVAMTWTKATGEVCLFVDGKKVANGPLAPRERLDGSVARIGFGAPNFPNQSAFQGSIRDVRFFRRALSNKEIIDTPTTDPSLMGRWLSEAESVGPKASLTKNPNHQKTTSDLIAGLLGNSHDCEFNFQDGRLVLNIPPSDEVRTLALWITRPTESQTDSVTQQIQSNVSKRLQNSTSQKGFLTSKPLWPEVLSTTAAIGTVNEDGFAVDILTSPDPNPWLARLRFSGLDFFADGDRMAVCSWDGDVYEVSGLKDLDAHKSATLKWKRIASGLFQPLGIKIVNEQIYLTCRDQLVILRDSNQDGETDYYECFNNDHQVTEHFHEFAMGLQRDDAGNFYYAKSARHALTAVVPHHGTLLRVSPDGSKTDIMAVGFRAANGVCLNPDGSFVVTDQEGHWNPKNRINWVVPGGFYGNMYGYHDVTDESDAAMRQPLCWITNSFDRSPAELLWVNSDRWGNLDQRLLNLSYGYGKVYVVPHQQLGATGSVQGGMCQLPIPQFPTGTMRGRFHPKDGQLYVCGLFAWGSSQQTKEGGLYRVRYSGHEATVPVEIIVSDQQLSVTFSDPLDSKTTTELSRYAFKSWDLKRSKNYGSNHYNELELPISSATLSEDHKTLKLMIPKLQATWCYELNCQLKTESGRSIDRVIHGTIHDVNP